MWRFGDRLCGLLVRVPGYRTEMYCFLWGTNWIYVCYVEESRGLVVRVLGYRSGGPGSIPGTNNKKRVVGLERGPLSLVSTTEELLDRKVAAPV
jgi:hypothetical protein